MGRLAGCYSCWNLSILKSNIIAEIPLLFKLIYFLMVYLNTGICILFHSKCYDSTCPVLDKTPNLREKRETLQERSQSSHLSIPTWQHWPAARGGCETAWCFRLSGTLGQWLPVTTCSLLGSLLLQFNTSHVHRGAAEPHQVHWEGAFILEDKGDLHAEVECLTKLQCHSCWLLLASDRQERTLWITAYWNEALLFDLLLWSKAWNLGIDFPFSSEHLHHYM